MIPLPFRCLLLCLCLTQLSRGTVWQFATELPPPANGRAFLRIPPDCHQRRGIILAQQTNVENNGQRLPCGRLPKLVVPTGPDGSTLTTNAAFHARTPPEAAFPNRPGSHTPAFIQPAAPVEQSLLLSR